MSPISRRGTAQHTHTEFAPLNHTHQGGGEGGPHDHEGVYSPTDHTHAFVIHTHDYADPHAHPYAADDHTHDTTHNHDSAYSASGHTHAYAASSHSHVDADLPAGLARDAEVAAAYSAIGHTHAYAATSHSHVDGDLPAGLARDAEVAAAYSPLAHTHSYEAAGAVAAHAGAGDPHPGYLTQSEGDARYALSHSHDYAASGHTHTLADGDIPATIARDSEVAAAYSPLGHTHGGGGNDARLIAIHKAADQAITGTAVVDITGMSFTAEANATYVFTMWLDIIASGGTTPTHNYQFTGPASPDRVMVKRTQMTSASAQATTVVTALATGFGAGATVANIKQIFEGIIKTGAAGGTVQLRVTPAGTTPTSTVGRGSGGYALKVS